MGNRFHIDVRSNCDMTVGDYEWITILVNILSLLKANWPHVSAYLEEYQTDIDLNKDGEHGHQTNR